MIALILEATCELNHILGMRNELSLVRFHKILFIIRFISTNVLIKKCTWFDFEHLKIFTFTLTNLSSELQRLSESSNCCLSIYFIPLILFHSFFLSILIYDLLRQKPFNLKYLFFLASIIFISLTSKRNRMVNIYSKESKLLYLSKK